MKLIILIFFISIFELKDKVYYFYIKFESLGYIQKIIFYRDKRKSISNESEFKEIFYQYNLDENIP